MVNRITRVNELLKEQLSLILENNFDKKNCLVTISEVKTSPDLRQARVFVSIFPYGERDEVIKELKRALPIFQAELGRKISLKYTPKIEIFFDESFEKQNRLNDLFDQIDNDKMNS